MSCHAIKVSSTITTTAVTSSESMTATAGVRAADPVAVGLAIEQNSPAALSGQIQSCF
jgi:hypothetical protein